MYIKYLKSLLWHKYYVFVAGRKLGVNLWQLLVHDFTKFSKVEFISYAQYFYGDWPETAKGPLEYRHLIKTKADVKAAFDKGWLHHLHHNPHHWQYWLLQNDDDGLVVLYMPQKYSREMVADWLGAGRAYNGVWDMTKWLDGHFAGIQLHPDTRAYVESLLTSIDNGRRYEK